MNSKALEIQQTEDGEMHRLKTPFATTFFSAIQRCHIVATFVVMLFQETVKVALKIVVEKFWVNNDNKTESKASAFQRQRCPLLRGEDCSVISTWVRV